MQAVNRFPVRSALAAAALALLAGCSALQIDVDVYKGPLANDDEMQRDQLVSMVVSAKSLMLTVRNKTLDRYQNDWDKNDTPHGAPQRQGQADCQGAARPPWQMRRRPLRDHEMPRLGVDRLNTERETGIRAARQLNQVLRAFQQIEDTEDNLDSARVRDGIDQLAFCYAMKRDAAAAHGSAAQDSDKRKREAAQDSDKRKREAEQAFNRLRHAMVDMAARMQFLATNLWIVDGEQALIDDLRSYKSLLESVANSIIVHADDLSRRQKHTSRLADPAAVDSERRAQAAAFSGDAARSLDTIVKFLEGQRLAALQSEQTQVSANQGLVAAKSAATEAEGKLTEAKSKLGEATTDASDGAALLASLIAAPAPKKPAAGAEPHADVQADVKALAEVLKGDDTATNPESLRAKLLADITVKANRYSAPALQSDPRGQRLRAAARFLSTQISGLGARDDPEMPRGKAIEELRKLIASASNGREKQRADLTEAEMKLRGARDTAKAVVQRLEKSKPAGATPFDSTAYTAAISALAEVSGEVRGQVKSADVAAVKALLYQALEKAKKTDALKVLATVPAATPLQPPSTEAKTQLALLDDVIAQLRYGHLEALRTLGEDHAQTRQQAAALAEARRQREDLVYVRPSITYLRSAFAATALQTDPKLRWRNLLGANSLRTLTETGDGVLRLLGLKQENNEIAELDKAFWQNINSVRVSAAGSSNFVVAKDDIGNWYVKAMGSDPGAMVRTATNLALFNAGGRFDSNLLRINELRQRIDSNDAKDVERRALDTHELRRLDGKDSGGGAAARGSTLDLFKANYDTVSAQQLSALAEKIKSDTLGLALQQRWESSAGNTADANLLKTVLATDAAKGLQAEALAAATPTADSKTAPGKAILATLSVLQRQRTALRAAVQVLSTLTSDETQERDKLKGEVDAEIKTLAGLAASEREAGTEFSAAEKALQVADSSADKDKLPAAKARFSTASTRRTEAVAATEAAQKRVDDKREQLKKADIALTAAQARQSVAVKDVDEVWKPEIERLVAERLRIVSETETAVKIVGGNGS